LKGIYKSKEGEFNLCGIIKVFDFWGFICIAPIMKIF